MTATRFGLSLSTSPAAEADPLGMAVRAEELGIDFISATDHPGGSHPSYETWTLLTWIAASTTGVGITTKVLSVPMRLPALTAKMAETLQRLSGGRLILGLGGGFSDEEMGSFGLPPRSAGEKVSGLAEAVQIIRELWSQPMSSFDGQIYRTDSAEIEPKPDPRIPIWLGTFGDRALATTGRLADGWIPSFGYAPPDVVVGMRAKMRSAAARAGRDPDDITCAYSMQVRIGEQHEDPSIVSGSASHVTDQLLGFTKLGFTALNLALVGPDEREQLELLARDVIPAVHAAVLSGAAP